MRIRERERGGELERREERGWGVRRVHSVLYLSLTFLCSCHFTSLSLSLLWSLFPFLSYLPFLSFYFFLNKILRALSLSLSTGVCVCGSVSGSSSQMCCSLYARIVSLLFHKFRSRIPFLGLDLQFRFHFPYIFSWICSSSIRKSFRDFGLYLWVFFFFPVLGVFRCSINSIFSALGSIRHYAWDDFDFRFAVSGSGNHWLRKRTYLLGFWLRYFIHLFISLFSMCWFIYRSNCSAA